MERRQFLKETCRTCALIILAGTALTSCGTGAAITGLVKTSLNNGKVSLPLNSMLQPGVKLIRVKDYPYDIALTKLTDGSFTAMVLRCTHASQALTKAGSGYYCTLHGSRFDKDGKVVKGPASEPLQHLPLQTDDASIWITVIQS